MATHRNYRLAYARRNELARQRGFRSYGHQRRYTRLPASLDDLTRLPEEARSSRSEAFRVIDLARADRISPQEAANQLGVRWPAVSWWAAESLGPTRYGRTELTRRDGLRMRPVIFENGVDFVAVRGWKRKEVERIFGIQWAAAHGMATVEELDWLQRRRVAGRPIADTQERLHKLARRGEIDPGEAYRVLVT